MNRCETVIVRPYCENPEQFITRPWEPSPLKFIFYKTVNSHPPYLLYRSACYGNEFKQTHCPTCGREGAKGTK